MIFSSDIFSGDLLVVFHLIESDSNGLPGLHLVKEAGQLAQIDPQLEVKVQDDHLLHPED
jgi:hypothetical protein